MTEKLQGLELLRAPFPPHQVNQLPKQMKKDDRERFACRPGTNASADNKYCGGYHARSIHLDYVGHAALTDRLLDVDPNWSWEPLAVGDDGLPKFDGNGGLWIKLSICGITRLGYGDSQGKTGGNAVKEAIGDALRNAGMRFGAALDLWHKGELHDTAEEQGKLTPPPEEAAAAPRTIQRKTADMDDVKKKIDACKTVEELKALWNEYRDAGAPDSVLSVVAAAGKEKAQAVAA